MLAQGEKFDMDWPRLPKVQEETILALAPFQSWINGGKGGLELYAEHLRSVPVNTKVSDFTELFQVFLENGWLESGYRFDFIRLHPMLAFRLNRLLPKAGLSKEQLLEAFAAYSESYAQEIFKKLLESGKESLYQDGLTYVAIEFENFQKAIYVKLYRGEPAFFLYACLLTYAKDRYDRNNYIDFLQDLREQFASRIPKKPEVLQRQFLGSLLNELGKALSEFNRRPEAKEVLEEALGLFNDLKDLNGKAHVLTTLGNLALNLQKEERAREYYLQSIQIYTQLGKRVEAADTRLNLSGLHRKSRQFEEAHKQVQLAIAVFDDQQKVQKKAFALFKLGEIYLAMRAFDEGKEALETALPIFQAYHDYSREGKIHKELGYLYQEQGDFKRCFYHFKAYIEKLYQLPGTTSAQLGSAFNMLGSASFTALELEEAMFYFEKAQSLLSDEDDLATSQMNLGAVYQKMDKNDQAIRFYSLALGYFERSGKALPRAKVHQNLGICYYYLNDYPEAKPHFQAAIRFYQLVNETYHIAAPHEYLGYIYLEEKNAEKAWMHLLETIKAYWQSEQLDFLDHLLKNMASMMEVLDEQSIINDIVEVTGWTQQELREKLQSINN